MEEGEISLYMNKQNGNDNEKNQISNLKNALSSKDKIILKLQKELELNELKNNLNNQEILMKIIPNTNRSLERHESYCDLKENNSSNNINVNQNLIPMVNKPINKNIKLEDIQKQIEELNIELKNKKNLLNKIKKQTIDNENKSRTCSNWKVNINKDNKIKELKEKIDKFENENIELKASLKLKEKEIYQLKDENLNNKEE